MTKICKKNENEMNILNYSDDELTFKNLYVRCQSLKTQQMQMLKIKQDLLFLNEKYKTTSESLIQMKKNYEFYKSHLQKTLFNLNVSIDKQTILSRKKLDEFFEKRKAFEEYYEVSPMKHEFKKLVNQNKTLEEEWKCKADLLELTIKQYNELMNIIIKTLRNKICEFCDAVLRFKEANN